MRLVEGDIAFADVRERSNLLFELGGALEDEEGWKPDSSSSHSDDGSEEEVLPTMRVWKAILLPQTEKRQGLAAVSLIRHRDLIDIQHLLWLVNVELFACRIKSRSDSK